MSDRTITELETYQINYKVGFNVSKKDGEVKVNIQLLDKSDGSNLTDLWRCALLFLIVLPRMKVDETLTLEEYAETIKQRFIFYAENELDTK